MLGTGLAADRAPLKLVTGEGKSSDVRFRHGDRGSGVYQLPPGFDGVVTMWSLGLGGDRHVVHRWPQAAQYRCVAYRLTVLVLVTGILIVCSGRPNVFIPAWTVAVS